MEHFVPETVVIKDAEATALFDDRQGTKTECPYTGRTAAIWLDSYYRVTRDLTGDE